MRKLGKAAKMMVEKGDAEGMKNLTKRFDEERQKIKRQLQHRSESRLIVKNGDDVRQDQLMLQIIRVMDNCLKRVGLDLKLTSYGVLATAPQAGLLEYIQTSDGSLSTSVEMLNEKSNIMNYLIENQPDPDNNPIPVKEAALENFCKSSAGYAVITYLLGVGDRHLGNVMMLPDGRFCHIDFGWIFGDDPKKKFVAPPPFRITAAMVDAMGGPDGKHFRDFCKYSCQAYRVLRKNVVLIMSLLRLMQDAGIEALESGADLKFRFVEDRFMLRLTDDDEAEEHFLRPPSL